MKRIALVLLAAALFSFVAHAQDGPPTPDKQIRSVFDDISGRVLAMAKDFPEAKYDYTPQAGVRSFREVIVHLTSGFVVAAKRGRGEKYDWTEIDPKTLPTKAAAVAALEKAIHDASEALKDEPKAQFAVSIAPWLGCVEHSGEHYGQLVVYYRNNGLVPPESRK